MKPNFTLLPEFISAKSPFVIKEIIRPAFATDFHFHEECQLVYIESGAGTRIIGDSIEQFEAGDLTFIGPRVPHVWYSKPKSNENDRPDVSIALYLNPMKVLEATSLFGDTQLLKSFFQDSTRGIVINGNKRSEIVSFLQKMIHQKNITAVASFFKILDLLLETEGLVWLNDSSLISAYSKETRVRVMKLMEYIQQNFKSEISLEKAATVANLQLHSFCRFFKKLTHRTFSDFINEMRIAYACQLLRESDTAITQIAFETGYTNISYFNRCFKKIHRMTPKEYREKE